MWCVVIILPVSTFISSQYCWFTQLLHQRKTKDTHMCVVPKINPCVRKPSAPYYFVSEEHCNNHNYSVHHHDAGLTLHILLVRSRLDPPHTHVTRQHTHNHPFSCSRSGGFISSLSSPTHHVTNIRLICCLFGFIWIAHDWRRGWWIW